MILINIQKNKIWKPLVVVFCFAYFSVYVGSVFAATGTIDTSVLNQAKVCHDPTCTTPTPGVINFELTSVPAITIDSVSGISGKVWGNELGWIIFNPAGSGVFFADSSTGLLTGKAWSQAAGFINFGVTGQSVLIDPSNGEFDGWAWAGGAHGGWIKFDCSDPSSCVKTTWRASSTPSPSGGGGSASGGIFTGNTGNPPLEEISNLPTCPTVLGDFVAKADNVTKSNKQSKNISNNKTVVVLNFDYSVNNGTTIQEINDIFKQAIRIARAIRKQSISSSVKSSVNNSAVVAQANDVFGIARDLARKARKAALFALKNRPILPTTPATPTPPLPNPQTPQTSSPSLDSGVDAAPADVVDSNLNTNTQTVPTNTGVSVSVSTGPNGEPCVLVENTTTPPVVPPTENIPQNPPDANIDQQTEDAPSTPENPDNEPGLVDQIIEEVSNAVDNIIVEYYSNVPPGLQDIIADIYNSSNDGLVQVREVVANPTVRKTGMVLTVVPLVTSTTVLFNLLSSGVPLINFLNYLVFIVPQFLIFKKSRKPWGTVYDSSTNRPLPFVKVSLLNAEMRKLDSTVTDIDGRYGFIISEQYTKDPEFRISLVVEKENYTFPSKKEQPSTNEKMLYSSIYKGDIVTVENSFVRFDIPMDPLKDTYNFIPYSGNVSVRFNNLWVSIADGLFAIGIVFATMTYVLDMRSQNLIPVVLVLITALFRSSGVLLRSFGVTLDKDTKQLIPFGLVTLNTTNGERVNFAVSDSVGRYFLLAPKGEYIVQAYTPAHIVPQREVNINLHTKEGWVSNEISI